MSGARRATLTACAALLIFSGCDQPLDDSAQLSSGLLGSQPLGPAACAVNDPTCIATASGTDSETGTGGGCTSDTQCGDCQICNTSTSTCRNVFCTKTTCDLSATCGNHACSRTYVANGTQAGTCNAAASLCSNADYCNGAGSCSPNDVSSGPGPGCSNPPTVCASGDSCAGAGSCNHNYLPSGTQTGTTCIVCDGNGNTVGASTPQPGCNGPATACNGAESCNGGVCDHNYSPDGTATSTPCIVCDGSGGMRPIVDGTSCGDPMMKCEPYQCMGGVCTAVAPVSCAVTDCHAPPHCDEPTGQCVGDTPLNGSTCGNNACAADVGTCTSGVCSATPKDCSSFGSACSVGICDITRGCQSQNRADGTACSPDPCHTGSSCTNGVCGAPLTCMPMGPCLTAGCDPASGCTNTPVAAGTPCDPGNDCLQPGSCDDSGSCRTIAKSDGSFCRRLDCGGVTALCSAGVCECGGPDLAMAAPPDLGRGSGLSGSCDVSLGSVETMHGGLWLLMLLALALALSRARSS